jgi:hypothetical protein
VASRSLRFEAKCQYRGEGGDVQVSSYPAPPCGQGTASSFIGQGEVVYNHATQF